MGRPDVAEYLEELDGTVYVVDIGIMHGGRVYMWMCRETHTHTRMYNSLYTRVRESMRAKDLDYPILSMSRVVLPPHDVPEVEVSGELADFPRTNASDM